MVVVEQCLSCGEPIAQPPGRGRRRRWCSDRCRHAGRRAAERRAVANRADLKAALIGGSARNARVAAALAALDDASFVPAEDPDGAVIEVLAQAFVLAERLRRVAVAARPEVSAFCEELADDLAVGLEHFFAPESTVRPFSARDEAAQAQ